MKDSIQEIQKIRTLDELSGYSLEELLHEVVCSREAITVVLEEGELITIGLAA